MWNTLGQYVNISLNEYAARAVCVCMKTNRGKKWHRAAETWSEQKIHKIKSNRIRAQWTTFYRFVCVGKICCSSAFVWPRENHEINKSQCGTQSEENWIRCGIHTAAVFDFFFFSVILCVRCLECDMFVVRRRQLCCSIVTSFVTFAFFFTQTLDIFILFELFLFLFLSLSTLCFDIFVITLHSVFLVVVMVLPLLQ